MKAFAELYAALDETTKTNEKVAALTRYFCRRRARGRRVGGEFPARAAGPSACSNRASWRSGPSKRPACPDWLFGECYHAVGDFAETIALLLPPPAQSHRTAAALLGGGAPAARCATPMTIRAARWLVSAWREMDERQRFAWNKLHHRRIPRRRVAEPGGARAGRGQRSRDRGHRASADGRLAADARILAAAGGAAMHARCATVSRPVSVLPRVSAGRRRRGTGRVARTGRSSGSGTASARSSSAAQGQTFLWSRGEELITDRFPGAARRSARCCPRAP